MIKDVVYTLLALYLLVVLIWIVISWKLIGGYPKGRDANGNQLYYSDKPIRRILICVANGFLWPYLIVLMVKDSM